MEESSRSLYGSVGKGGLRRRAGVRTLLAEGSLPGVFLADLGVGAPSWSTAARSGCLSRRETGVAAPEGTFTEAMLGACERHKAHTHTQRAAEGTREGRGGGRETSRREGRSGRCRPYCPGRRPKRKGGVIARDGDGALGSDGVWAWAAFTRRPLEARWNSSPMPMDPGEVRLSTAERQGKLLCELSDVG